MALIRQTADGLGFVTEVESVNAVEAWLGSLPGQAYADVRRPILLTPSLAHLLPASSVWAGEPHNAHLNAEPLLLAATDGATPFRLNLHVGDVGHTLVIGPTGAGKSVLLGLLAAQWLRYGSHGSGRAQVYLFDKGRSARAAILGLGGEVFDLGADDALGFQPLRDIDDLATRAWAQDWLLGLLEGQGLAIAPDLKTELWRALDLLAERPKADRTLSLLSALVQDRSARSALEPFTHEGPYGALLDCDRSELGYGAVQAFEMETLLRQRPAAGPVLQVIFHLLDKRFTGAPTLLILDEAWLFLQDRMFAAEIQAWLKTLRKRNVAVVFASQELADVEASPIASTLFEACATRIFLPNDRAREPRTRALYEAAGLNDRQIQLIAEAAAKRDYYVVSRQGSRLMDLELGPAALAFLGASSAEDQKRIDRVLREAASSGRSFARAWLEDGGLKAASEALERFEVARGGAASAGPRGLDTPEPLTGTQAIDAPASPPLRSQVRPKATQRKRRERASPGETVAIANSESAP